MECYLLVSGVSSEIFYSLKKVKDEIESLNGKHYELIKCIKSKDVFFITGKKIKL